MFQALNESRRVLLQALLYPETAPEQAVDEEGVGRTEGTQDGDNLASLPLERLNLEASADQSTVKACETALVPIEEAALGKAAKDNVIALPAQEDTETELATAATEYQDQKAANVS